MSRLNSNDTLYVNEVRSFEHFRAVDIYRPLYLVSHSFFTPLEDLGTEGLGGYSLCRGEVNE